MKQKEAGLSPKNLNVQISTKHNKWAQCAFQFATGGDCIDKRTVSYIVLNAKDFCYL